MKRSLVKLLLFYIFCNVFIDLSSQNLYFSVNGISVRNGSTFVYKTLDPDWEAFGGVVFAPTITVTTDAAATVTVTGKETTGQLFSMSFGGNCVIDKEITKQKALAANESVNIGFDVGNDNPMLGGIKTYTVDLKAYVEGKESEGTYFTIICSNDPCINGGYFYDKEFNIDGICYSVSASGNIVYVTSNNIVNNVPSSTYSGDIIIPNKVTYNDIEYSVVGINDNAFQNCKELNSVTLPPYLTTIGKQAFSGCCNLTKINLTGSLSSIGDEAFSNCIGLSQIKIPTNVTNIGNSAFKGCIGMSEIIFNAENTSSGPSSAENSWFNECPNITSFKFGENVKCIPSFLCWNMQQIETIILPTSLESIGNNAFSGCINLSEITIPQNVTAIGNSAFSDCSKLITVNYYPENLNNIDGWFKNCDNLTTFIFEDGVRHIPGSICYGLKNLKYVVFPNSLVSIGDSSFYCCSLIENIEFPNSLQTIGNSAFYYCENLKSIIIPQSIIEIGDYAFAGCSILSSIQCYAELPPSLGTDVFLDVDKSSCVLIVPDDSIEAYKTSDQWKDFLNATKVEEISMDNTDLAIENGKIINTRNENIEVYNLSGMKVYLGNEAEVSFNSGVYIVLIGDKAVKIKL